MIAQLIRSLVNVNERCPAYLIIVWNFDVTSHMVSRLNIVNGSLNGGGRQTGEKADVFGRCCPNNSSIETCVCVHGE